MTLCNCVLDRKKVDGQDACALTQKDECLTLKDVETDGSKNRGKWPKENTERSQREKRNL